MNSGLQAICAEQAACKCCGASAFPYGVVDFHKNCEINRRKVLDISGVPIYYHRCPACRFIFTTAFDHFTKDDFLRHIYNEEYLLVDPDYRESAAAGNADLLCRPVLRAPGRGASSTTGAATAPWRIGSAPRASRGSRPTTPSSRDYSDRPADRFDCVVSFEVVEHSTDPERTFADMNEFLADPGLIVFSTLLQPPISIATA